eukprot:TRINITY_DN3059_c0_g1_i1.p1 TRINITY_DN3059_c0_g1~~TRINITY_DN3059_c0_g1_i1.p1  ORF type:complete len:788 (-),score=218.86 TRINITY_DN3059_c0_g1_i1:1257-3620(-)
MPPRSSNGRRLTKAQKAKLKKEEQATLEAERKAAEELRKQQEAEEEALRLKMLKERQEREFQENAERLKLEISNETDFLNTRMQYILNFWNQEFERREWKNYSNCLNVVDLKKLSEVNEYIYILNNVNVNKKNYEVLFDYIFKLDCYIQSILDYESDMFNTYEQTMFQHLKDVRNLLCKTMEDKVNEILLDMISDLTIDDDQQFLLYEWKQKNNFEEFYGKHSNYGFGLWLNTSRNAARLDSIDFPELGCSVFIPPYGTAKALLFANIAIRIIVQDFLPREIREKSLDDYAILGPCYSVDIIQLADPPKKLSNWTIREVTKVLTEIVCVPYPPKQTRVRRTLDSAVAKESASSSRRRPGSRAKQHKRNSASESGRETPTSNPSTPGPEHAERIGTPSMNDDQKIPSNKDVPITISIPKFTNVVSRVSASISNFTNDRWTSFSLTQANDSKRPENEAFETMRLGTFAYVMEKTADLPYRNWRVGPVASDSDDGPTVAITLFLKEFDEEECLKNMCDYQYMGEWIEMHVCHKGVKLVHPKGRQVKHLQEYSAPHVFLRKLEKTGFLVYPNEDDIEYVLKMQKLPHKNETSLLNLLNLVSIGSVAFTFQHSYLSENIEDFVVESSINLDKLNPVEIDKDLFHIPWYHEEPLPPQAKVETNENDEVVEEIVDPTKVFKELNGSWKVIEVNSQTMCNTDIRPGLSSHVPDFPEKVPSSLPAHAATLPILEELVNRGEKDVILDKEEAMSLVTEADPLVSDFVKQILSKTCVLKLTKMFRPEYPEIEETVEVQ